MNTTAKYCAVQKTSHNSSNSNTGGSTGKCNNSNKSKRNDTGSKSGSNNPSSGNSNWRVAANIIGVPV